MTCAPPASFAPVGISRPSACSVAAGSSPRSENSSGARSGGAMSWAAETATRQSAVSTSVIGARARVAVARGEDRLRDAGRVGDRIGAADARRVARRERREAELGGRLLVVALAPEHGRLLGGAAPASGLVGASVAAAAAGRGAARSRTRWPGAARCARPTASAARNPRIAKKVVIRPAQDRVLARRKIANGHSYQVASAARPSTVPGRSRTPGGIPGDGGTIQLGRTAI